MLNQKNQIGLWNWVELSESLGVREIDSCRVSSLNDVPKHASEQMQQVTARKNPDSPTLPASSFVHHVGLPA